MRAHDQRIFAEAARHFRLWILVRPTNPESLPYIGQPGYRPKRIDCKAKTAKSDVGRYRLAGLVASPLIHPAAFRQESLAEAFECWSETIERPVFSLDQDRNSPHFGCLRLEGRYLHGDYDLKDIVDPKEPHRNLALVGTLHGVEHRVGARFYLVQQFINTRIGVPMIQHGGEAQYADHSDEPILGFDPEGTPFSIPQQNVARWYQEKFGGRPTLGN